MKVTATKNVEFAGHPRRKSRYDAIFSRMSRLSAGKSLLVPIKDLGPDKRTAHNRLSNAMRRAGPPPPKGCKWVKRTTTNEEIAISAVRKPRKR